MRLKTQVFLRTAQKTDYESMVVLRGWTPPVENFGPVTRTYMGLLAIAALACAAWIAAENLHRPAGSDIDAATTIGAEF